MFIRFQTKDGTWHDYRDFPQFEDDDILKIKISDNGIGYDSRSLGLFASIKNPQESSGKWGEGIKIISASALRQGIKMEIRSRNWMATPFFTKVVLNQGKVNEREVERLNFKIRTLAKEDSTALKDDDNQPDSVYGFEKSQEQSSTTFVEPTPELIKYFRNIREGVLTFSDKDPMVSLENADILSMTGGKLYIKNIFIPGNHQLRYSYHLKNFDIETRDRNAIEIDSMKYYLSNILENVSDEQFIKMFLMEGATFAAKDPEKCNCLEFNTDFYIPSRTKQADLWIKVFQSYFGEDACIRSLYSLDSDDVSKAQHMGLGTITLPNSIATTLSNLEGTDGKKIPTYEDALQEAIKNAIPVPNEALTDEERAIIAQLRRYNEILLLNPTARNYITEINVYDYDPDYQGKRAYGYAKFGNTVNISRDALEKGLKFASHVFFHESGHAETGANDVEPEFRDFQTMLLAELSTRFFPLEKSVMDNGLIGQTRFSKFKAYIINFIKKMSWKSAKKEIIDLGVLDEEEEQNDEKGDER